MIRPNETLSTSRDEQIRAAADARNRYDDDAGLTPAERSLPRFTQAAPQAPPIPTPDATRALADRWNTKCDACGALPGESCWDEDKRPIPPHAARVAQPAAPRPRPRRRPKAAPPIAEPGLIRCHAPGCGAIAVTGITTARPWCGFPAHEPAALDRAAALAAANPHTPDRRDYTPQPWKDKPAPEPTATVTELPPVPPAAAAEIRKATAKRKATVEAARELSTLDRAVEQLVREHSSGAVIDAAWNAAHRIFAPQAGRA